MFLLENSEAFGIIGFGAPHPGSAILTARYHQGLVLRQRDAVDAALVVFDGLL